MIDQLIWLKPNINVFRISFLTCITPNLCLIRSTLRMKPIAVHYVLDIDYLTVLILIKYPLFLHVTPAVITDITDFLYPEQIP